MNLDKVTRQMAAQLGNLVGSKVGHHDPVDGNLGVRGLQMQLEKMGELPP